jgi:hypothetical protein
MDGTINERFIKLSSKVPYPSDLALGEDLTVLIQGNPYVFNVVKQEINDKQDGTVDVTFVCKSLSE